MKSFKVKSGNRAHLFNNGEYPRLVVVVAVGTHAEIDLLWEGICLVGSGELENAIATGQGDSLGVV
jgi:hypothetical protein